MFRFMPFDRRTKMTTRILLGRTGVLTAFLIPCVLMLLVAPVEVRGAEATVKVTAPADGAVLYWTQVQGNQQWSVKVDPENLTTPPPCYAAVIQFRNPPKPWTHMTGMKNPISQSYPMSFAITWFGEDALYRIKAAGSDDCNSFSLSNEGNYVWTAWSHYTIERKELAGLKKDPYRAVDKNPMGPTLKSQAALETDMKVLPGSGLAMPMSGDAPAGPGGNAAHSGPRLKKVKAPDALLTFGDFRKTNDPGPGDMVNVKVQVKNDSGQHSPKDTWTLEVKCEDWPNKGGRGKAACEQQMKPANLPEISAGDSIWKSLAPAVKVRAYGSYRLKAILNNRNGNGGSVKDLSFTLVEPRVEREATPQRQNTQGR
jgi:hypothetical protein